MSIMTAPTLLLLTDHARLDIHQQLQDLCRPACMSRFIAYYFEIWHLNCRIVHWLSFGFGTCDESLVLAVVLLGAMYSPGAAERLAASAVIDHVESYVFSCLPLSHPASGNYHEDPDGVSHDEKRFQISQAAFIMVITQFWTGSGEQKLRASTRLFNIVVEARAFCVYIETGQHLMTTPRTECTLDRLDEDCAVSPRQAH